MKFSRTSRVATGLAFTAVAIGAAVGVAGAGTQTRPNNAREYGRGIDQYG